MAPRRFSSTSLSEGPFRSNEAEDAFNKLQRTVGITDSKTLIQSRIHFPITDLFKHSPFTFILALAFPFHSTLLYQFYANLTVTADFTTMSSRVFCTDVIITKEDLAEYLHIPRHGESAYSIASSLHHNWSNINRAIRNSSFQGHQSSVSGLVLNARVIQHVLRHAVLPKAGDRSNITPLLSVVTYYVMTNTPFDVADLLIRFIHNVSTTREPDAKKRQNLVLGHVIAYILQTKFAIANPSEPDHMPTYFTDHSFHTLYGGKKAKGKRPTEDSEEEEDEGGEEEAPFTQGEASQPSYPSREWATRIERKIDDIQQYQQQSRTWLEGKFEDIMRRLPPRDDDDAPDF